MCTALVARNAAQALSREPIAFQPSDGEGRKCDQQGWYRGKRFPSLDGTGFLIHKSVRTVNPGLKNTACLEVAMLAELDLIERKALRALESAQDDASLEAWRIAHLG